MTSRKPRARTAVQREAEASVALDGETQSYDPASAVTPIGPEALPEDAVEVVAPYEDRFEAAVKFVMEQVNEDLEATEETLLQVFPRGEYTVFVYRVTGIRAVIPEQDGESLPYFEALPSVMLQTVATFNPKTRAWVLRGDSPRPGFLQVEG